jgi:hypothetical protein
MGLENSPEVGAALEEQVSDAELKLLLSRLGEREQGGSSQPTVAAVAEATGFSRHEVGQALADLRRELGQPLAVTAHEARGDLIRRNAPIAAVILGLVITIALALYTFAFFSGPVRIP